MRLDLGRKRKATLTGGDLLSKRSRTEFVNTRRAAADALAKSIPTLEGLHIVEQIENSDLSGHGWTDRHEKELMFQLSKRQHRLCEAVNAGHRHSDEVDDDLQRDAQAQNDHDRSLATAAVKKAARNRARLDDIKLQTTALDLGCMNGKSCYIGPSVCNATLQRRCQVGLGMLLVPHAQQAAVVCVNDVADLPPIVDVALRIQGGLATTPEVLLGVRNGPVVSFLAATHVKRKLWLSDRFIHENREVVDCLRSAVHRDDSKWTLIDSAEKFEEIKAKTRSKPSSVLGLATAVETAAIRHAKPNMGKHVFVLGDFLLFVARLNQPHCRSGIQ